VVVLDYKSPDTDVRPPAFLPPGEPPAWWHDVLWLPLALIVVATLLSCL
jgi:hypothetical protein